jgi:exodeoxyribonuclease VII large subunit
VPDVAEETDQVSRLRDRARRVLQSWIAQQQHQLDAVRARPSLADPGGRLAERAREVEELRARTRRCLHHQLDRAHNDLHHQLARVRGLSPLATLERGYAVLQDADGHVVTRVEQVTDGDTLTARVTDGRVKLTVAGTEAEPTTPNPTTGEEPAR